MSESQVVHGAVHGAIMGEVIFLPIAAVADKRGLSMDMTSEISRILQTMDEGPAQSVERLTLVLARLQTPNGTLLDAVKAAPDNKSRRDILQQGRSIRSLILTAERRLRDVEPCAGSIDL